MELYYIISHLLLLYCKGTNLDDKQLQHNRCEERQTKRVKNSKVTLDILRIYTLLYHIYQILYCKEHIHMTSNYSKIEVKKKQKSKKMSISHLIHLAFILHYITLTFYYVVKDTYR